MCTDAVFEWAGGQLLVKHRRTRRYTVARSADKDAIGAAGYGELGLATEAAGTEKRQRGSVLHLSMWKSYRPWDIQPDGWKARRWLIASHAPGNAGQALSITALPQRRRRLYG